MPYANAMRTAVAVSMPDKDSCQNGRDATVVHQAVIMTH